MEACCSFKPLANGHCGIDRKHSAEETTIVPLLSCSKDIDSHLAALKFSGPVNEIELIISRVAMFEISSKVNSMTICPNHRSSLGLGWSRGGNSRCRVPQAISGHVLKSGRRLPKAEKGLNREGSVFILKKTGLFVPVGSAVCSKCRKKLQENADDEDHVTTMLGRMTVDDLEDVTFHPKHLTPGGISDGEDRKYTPLTLIDMYQPSEASFLTVDDDTPADTPKDLLNKFLKSKDISPIKHSLTTSWDEASARTRRGYITTAKQVVDACLEEIAPNDSEMLFESLCKVSQTDSTIDSVLLDALAECYNNALHWSTRRQVLSIMADKVTFQQLKRFIPDLTRYRYNIARHHLLLNGRGAVPHVDKHTRICIPQEKLDHFLSFITSSNVVQDLPFGEKTLILSTNVELKVPNVIRTLIPEAIVKQYQSYCKETAFQPMSRSTLCRIMKVCSATARKSLQGLDYVSADGAKAFDDLVEVVDKLGSEYDKGLSWTKDKIDKLKNAKRYLKSDFKVHVSSSSRVPDHCRTYALSFAGNKSFKLTCDHKHDLRCERCEIFPSVLQDILTVLKGNTNTEEIKELTYIVNQASQDIDAWKAHLLRSVNQDLARLDVLKKLTPNSALLVLDWAMKYLPRKFRESQTDWFGKRGIPWHITVAITRASDGKMQMLTFAHLFKSCTQDSSSVLAVIDDVFKQLKGVAPQITDYYLRADNAGCYHATTTLLGAKQLATKHNINLVQYDFSDPQGGKGSCDRKAASIKSKMKIYLNSGHDIETPEQMKQAIESSGGVPGLRATPCGPQPTSTLPTIKWKGISFLNNFKYTDKGLRVWRAYGIGAGNLIKWSEFSLPPSDSMKEIKPDTSASCSDASFVIVSAKRRLQSKALAVTTKETCEPETEDSDEDTDNDSNDLEVQASKLFICPEEGCVKSFHTFSGWQNHLDCGRHIYALEHETFLDKAMTLYATKLEQGSIDEIPSVEVQPMQLDPQQLSPLKMGWGLKSNKGRKRFTETQKEYLMAQFNIGEQTGHKVDPVTASKSMRKAKDSDGVRLFSPDDFLTSKQVASFFSRVSKKKVVPAEIDTQEDVEIEDDNIEASREKALDEMSKEVQDALSIQHPIFYDVYNLCKLAAENKMKRFSISMLQEMCATYDLDTSNIKYNRRKQPYIDVINDFLQSCSCMQSA